MSGSHASVRDFGEGAQLLSAHHELIGPTVESWAAPENMQVRHVLRPATMRALPSEVIALVEALCADAEIKNAALLAALKPETVNIAV